MARKKQSSAQNWFHMPKEYGRQHPYGIFVVHARIGWPHWSKQYHDECVTKRSIFQLSIGISLYQLVHPSDLHQFCDSILSWVLQASIHISSTRSRTYFWWDINIPCLDSVTSITRKYFKTLRSFISDSLPRVITCYQ